MKNRISKHRQERPQGWLTIEAPQNVAQKLAEQLDGRKIALLDCMTLLVSNIMLNLGDEPNPKDAEEAVLAEIKAITSLCRQQDTDFIIVSNEVGLGIVPAYSLGRLYRDLLGRANQLLAAEADQVIFMISGLPFELKKI